MTILDTPAGVKSGSDSLPQNETHRPTVWIFVDAFSRIRHVFRDEALEWRIPPALAELAFLAPIAGAAALLLTAAWPRLFVFLTREDGLFEWITVAGWLLAAACMASATRALWQRDWRWWAALYALVALACLVIIGEELSWGQRLLGVETPDAIDDRNEQGDLTAHNLAMLHYPYRLGMPLLGFYGSVFAYLVRRPVARVNSHAALLLLPPVFLSSTFLILMAYRSFRVLWIGEPFSYLWGFGEWPELTLPYALACFAYLLTRRMGWEVAESSTARDLSRSTVVHA